MVACAKLGLRVKYIGTVGDDERGRIQMESLLGQGINLDHVQLRKNCPNQSAYILIDHTTGERTVLWRRPDCLRIDPHEITPEQITCARLLHIDGHDTAAVARAAEIARAQQIPVTVDVDTIYPGFDKVLPNVDYLISSSEFPAGWTGEQDHFKALELIQKQYGMRVAAMTLGADGALARVDGKFVYSPGFRRELRRYHRRGRRLSRRLLLRAVAGLPMREALDFSNAMAALNCTAIGARGGIATLEQARSLLERAERRSNRDYLDPIRATGLGHDSASGHAAEFTRLRSSPSGSSSSMSWCSCTRYRSIRMS